MMPDPSFPEKVESNLLNRHCGLLEAELCLLKDLKLTYVSVGSWILIIRETCDFFVNTDEPYFALTLLYEPNSNQYICRVLGKTIEKGMVRSFSELLVKSEDHFKGRVACLGLKPTNSNFPFSCTFSKQCQTTFLSGIPLKFECQICPQCQNSGESERTSLNETIDSNIEADFGSKRESTQGLKIPLTAVVAKSLPKKRAAKSKDDEDESFQKRDRITEARPWTCPICQKSLAFGNSYKHMKHVHFEGHFKCAICYQEFKYAKDLTQHHLHSHPKVDHLACPSCEDDIVIETDRDALADHYKQCVRRRSNDQARKQLIKVKAEGRLFQCDECGKTLSSASNLTKHMKVHSDATNFQCHMCDYKTKWKVCLEKHIKRHLLDQGLLEKCICQLCGKELRTQKCLATHIQLVHEKSLQFACDKCEKQFTSRDILRRHKNRVHAESEEFACKKCSYRAGNKIELKTHFRCHGEPTFKCHHCGKMLKSKGSLRIHERIHTGEKPFKCEMCDYASNNSANLLNHKKFIHQNGKKLPEGFPT
ncbi:zinc finger protein 345-like [Tigriopus californicus]|uniref:zinc finger protein 345-like n=1 Tax=Tigriopus californicus TaxID=6832 RepID=UPI0027D9FF65|nr:zinc finger protein 345-like [Tigriopus californicus]